MGLLSKLVLPESGGPKAAKPTPIVQLPLSACLKWLNPRRAALGLPIYADTPAHGKAKVLPIPPVERLRSEIIDAVQNRTFEQTAVDDPTVVVGAGGRLYAATTAITLRKLAQYNAIPFSDVWTASYHGRQIEVEHYIATCGIDPNIPQFGYPYQTPLHCAVSGGATATAQYLVAKGASPAKTDINDNTPIHLAARWGRLDVLELFLRGPSLPQTAWVAPNRLGDTPIYMASQHGHISVTAFFRLHFEQRDHE
ncbi:hypothetical protein SDRG_08937 [Saprolegnia diclina VS20]|uniref:Uncharacterized protein n=1 Tax=Saprolegnia diclina (strain VS20) TaxID=1156394 RepID=T0RT32_SAPDV|nr:hypothetical protein SDRG_08937 [Saprolegnia diclina VS20]EQC33422.1 hypothetical protein SDRG_08937 [Saprolegnia diclina VS20]|eukprot:XP_008613062.1 hypothetical protein SDRG_08937 [Saprolegnia diclina VS20]